MKLTEDIKKEIWSLWLHSTWGVEVDSVYNLLLGREETYRTIYYEAEKETDEYELSVYVREHDWRDQWMCQVNLRPKEEDTPLFGYLAQAYWKKGQYDSEWIDTIWEKLEERVEKHDKKGELK